MDISLSRIIELLQFDPNMPLVFNSGMFLFLFLIFLAFHQIFHKARKARILYITLFSLYFYYKSTGLLAGLLLITSIMDFSIARLIHSSESERRRMLFLSASICMNLCLLGYFKYTNFFIDVVNSLASGDISKLDIFLPAGISFYTFQSLSYTIDVYRREIEPLDKYTDFCFCVSFFPHLVAGPIIRASYIIPQLANDYVVSGSALGRGIYLILAGVIKKAVIADYISINFVDRVFQDPMRYSGVENLAAVYGYALQIYCDFSGYSDMAIGIALLVGFKLPENFNSPYQAATVTEFWRRWHISLSSWLRDYLYMPLTYMLMTEKIRKKIAEGKYKTNYRSLFAMIAVFTLCGLWHGAAWKYIVWGTVHGCIISLETLLKIPKWTSGSRVRKFAGVLVTFHLVCFCWIFFRAENFAVAVDILSRIALDFNAMLIPQMLYGYWAVFSIIALGYMLHYLPGGIKMRIEELIVWMPLPGKAALVIMVILLVVQVKSAEIQPFIYFQF